MVSVLSGSSQRAFYQRTICLANRQGSVISDFNMEFTQGVNLRMVLDDIDAKALMPDGTYQAGELRTDYLPSGRTLTTTNITGAPDIIKVQSDRVSRLMLQVSLPSVVGDTSQRHPFALGQIARHSHSGRSEGSPLLPGVTRLAGILQLCAACPGTPAVA
ncbi:unnamed protein product, partial [Darwinula stevensoni]